VLERKRAIPKMSLFLASRFAYPLNAMTLALLRLYSTQGEKLATHLRVLDYMEVSANQSDQETLVVSLLFEKLARLVLGCQDTRPAGEDDIESSSGQDPLGYSSDSDSDARFEFAPDSDEDGW